MSTEHEIFRRVAGVLLVDGAGRVLLQHRDANAPTGALQWSVTGGGIEEGESPEDAARREIFEETGLTITHPLTLFEHSHDANGRGGTTERFIYCAATDASQADVACNEGLAIAFIPPMDVFALDLTASATPLLWAFLASGEYRTCYAQAKVARAAWEEA